MQNQQSKTRSVPYWEAFRVWVRVAVLSFGGPAGQIAVMHKLLVEEKRWIDEGRFLHALNYCMLLPGPEAQQLATYIGWLLNRTRGGLTAGLLFIFPGFISILSLSFVYVFFKDSLLISALFFGMKASVLAVVTEAVIRLGKKALKTSGLVIVAVISFIAIYFFKIPFPVIILGAAVVGYAGGKFRKHSPSPEVSVEVLSDESVSLNQIKPSWSGCIRSILVWGTVWIAPIVLLRKWLGVDNVLSEEAVFFSKAAVVTFGGAYAVLAYIAQQAVEFFGWLQPGEMITGLGFAETTPGPLIQVVQFVGFMGAFNNPYPFNPVTAAILGSLVTTWVTFTPCFLWIFMGAPFIEKLRENVSVADALSAVTAAVVGVMLNLAVWFTLHVIFENVHDYRIWKMSLPVPDLQTTSWASLLIAVTSFIAMLRFRVNMIYVMALSASAGILFKVGYAYLF